MTPISLDTASVITERSKRTWYRRIEDGSIPKIGGDPGLRTLVPLADVSPLISISMTPDDLSMLVRADSGDAEAQDDIGQLFLAAGKHAAALYWLEQAARQDYPNAMQSLGRCYLAGEGLPKDENLALMWIAKAAAHGHVIAQAQIDAIRAGAHPSTSEAAHR